MVKVLFYLIIVFVGLISISFFVEAVTKKNYVFLITSIIAFTSVILALILNSWWPLIIGFLVNTLGYSTFRN